MTAAPVTGSLSGYFQISLPSGEPAVDVTELWSSRVDPAYHEETWRAWLPEDSFAADDLLRQREQQLARIQRAIPGAQKRLEADLALLSDGGGLAFSTSAAAGPAFSKLAAGFQYRDPGVSFGWQDLPKVDSAQLDQAGDVASRFSQQVQRTINQLALVETVIGGRTAAVSRAGWSGDVQTWWAAGTPADQRLQHQRVLADQLATRQAWLRFLCVIAGGVTRVAAVLVTAPFSLLSIWTTWNYVQELIREVRKFHEAVR